MLTDPAAAKSHSPLRSDSTARWTDIRPLEQAGSTGALGPCRLNKKEMRDHRNIRSNSNDFWGFRWSSLDLPTNFAGIYPRYRIEASNRLVRLWRSLGFVLYHFGDVKFLILNWSGIFHALGIFRNGGNGFRTGMKRLIFRSEGSLKPVLKSILKFVIKIFG